MLATILLFFNACKKEDIKAVSFADEAYEAWVNDSAMIKIAVMPTLDCLPIYVASERGIFARNGASVSLYSYAAQMDCDTALTGGWVDAMATDLVRAERLKKQGMLLSYLTSTDLHWQLVASKMARVKRLNQMENKMVAMSRYSATDMLVSTDEIVMLRFSQRNGSLPIAITATSSGTPSESLAHSSTTTTGPTS